MTNRNREVAPGSWSLERERALTTRRSAEGLYSEHWWCVFRRAELPERNVKVKKLCKVDGV